MLFLVNPCHASVRHWLVAVSEPNQGVDPIANCSVAVVVVVGFVVNLNSLARDAAVGDLVGEKADFRERVAAEFAAEQVAFG